MTTTGNIPIGADGGMLVEGVTGPIPVSQPGTDVDLIELGSNTGIVLTMPAVAGKTNYVTGFEITGGGATAASLVLYNSLDGLLGGQIYYPIAVPAKPGAVFLSVQFARPIPASGVNVAIVLAVNAFGAGNDFSNAHLHGFYV